MRDWSAACAALATASNPSPASERPFIPPPEPQHMQSRPHPCCHLNADNSVTPAGSVHASEDHSHRCIIGGDRSSERPSSVEFAAALDIAGAAAYHTPYPIGDVNLVPHQAREAQTLKSGQAG